MKTTKAPFVAIVFLFCFCSISAQEAITVAGGEADGIGGSASYSVGQVFYTYNEAGSFSISDGVQQAFEISAITGIEDLLGINLTMSEVATQLTALLKLRLPETVDQNPA